VCPSETITLGAGRDEPFYEFEVHVTAESLVEDFRRWRAVVPGEVLAQFVVDTLGRPEPGSLCLLFKDVGPALGGQVVAILPRLRFRPAELPKGRRVRQIVQTPFRFY
jgi:hypothetical protein